MTDSSAQRPTDLIFQIMEFRTVYLKAVARAAIDIGFRRELTRNGDGGDALEILDRVFGYKCPWDLKLVLNDQPEDGPRVNMINGAAMTHPYQGESITIYIPNRPATDDWLEALAAYYQDHPWFLYSPKLSRASESFPSTGVSNKPQVHRHSGARHHLAEKAQELDEIFEKASGPGGLSSEDFVKLRGLPHMLRSIVGDTSFDDGRLDLFRERVIPPSIKNTLSGTNSGGPEWSSVDQDRSPTPRFDLGTSLDDFISFAAVMFNVVAMSWANEKFRRLITGEDYKDKLTVKASSTRTIQLLYQWFGYRYPWELALKIQNDPNDAKYWRADAAKNRKAGWDRIKSPELTLTLPWMTGAVDPNEETTLNARNPSVAIMGLVLYNTDGPGYPFTCG